MSLAYGHYTYVSSPLASKFSFFFLCATSFLSSSCAFILYLRLGTTEKKKESSTKKKGEFRRPGVYSFSNVHFFLMAFYFLFIFGGVGKIKAIRKGHLKRSLRQRIIFPQKDDLPTTSDYLLILEFW